MMTEVCWKTTKLIYNASTDRECYSTIYIEDAQIILGVAYNSE